MHRVALAIVLVSLAAVPARADLYYRYAITNPEVSGTLGGVAFTDASVTWIGIGDTANIDDFKYELRRRIG